jgi:hypothetical protein
VTSNRAEFFIVSGLDYHSARALRHAQGRPL